MLDRPRCRQCRLPLPPDRGWGDCEPCKAERRRLAHLHRSARADEPEADWDAGERARRVERYAALVAGGRRLFE